MSTPRGLYITLYILYLIFLGLSLWYLLYYTNVPSWVWLIFLGAIIISLFCLFIKEYILIRYIEPNGEFNPSTSFKVWSALYVVFHIVVFILFIIGIGYTINDSSVPWWVWVLFGTALFLTIMGQMIVLLSNENKWGIYTGMVFSFMALIVYIVAIVFLFTTSKCPWWVVLIVIFTMFFGIMAGFFETKSDKNVSVKNDKKYKSKKCVQNYIPDCDNFVNINLDNVNLDNDNLDNDNLDNDNLDNDNLDNDNLDNDVIIIEKDENSSDYYGDNPKPLISNLDE
jgi:hypothetical protein